MLIKFTKDQSWSFKGRILSFIKDEIREVDETLALDMIKFGYGEKVVKKIIQEEEKSLKNYEKKVIESSENKEEITLNKKKYPKNKRKNK